jgi:ABC-type lipoprotein export system ATPase subunit
MKISVEFNPTDNHVLSENEMTVRNLFGLPPKNRTITLIKDLDFLPKQINLINGFSGSGKSSLLNEISSIYPHAKNIDHISLTDIPVIDCLEGDKAEIIQWLSKFGVGEASVLVTPSNKLSEGQKERLKLALLFWEQPKIVVIDEFLSKLDRLTARVIAYQTQKIMREIGTQGFFATAHDDLVDALFPDQVLDLDFLGQISIFPKSWGDKVLKEKKLLKIEEGNFKDYRKLKRFHYMDRQTADQTIKDSIIKITRVTYLDRVVGVRVFTSPYPKHFEKLALFKLINKNICISSRVIVHPSFRGLGISKLLSKQLPNKSFICTHSALERFFPFDRASGYIEIDHPSIVETSSQKKLTRKLNKLGIKNLSILHDHRESEEFCKGLSSDQKNVLANIIKEVLSDYDFRLADYYMSLLNLNLSESIMKSIAHFFKVQASYINENNISSYISEALYFPMQGLYTKI